MPLVLTGEHTYMHSLLVSPPPVETSDVRTTLIYAALDATIFVFNL